MEKSAYEEKERSLKVAAENGDAFALKELGDLVFGGVSGSEENFDKAFPLWTKAQKMGELGAVAKIAQCYLNGIGVEKNAEKAFEYFKILADHKESIGYKMLGMCYEFGIGCPKSDRSALVWYEKAALMGDGEAQLLLAHTLMRRLETDEAEYTRNGVPLVIHWLCCAHLAGEKEATELLKEFAEDESMRQTINDHIDTIKSLGIDPKEIDRCLAQYEEIRNEIGKGSYNSSSKSESAEGGCYIATCVYGSYNCPQVWTLRRFRDKVLATSWYGRMFVRLYYAFGPWIVRWFGRMAWFHRFWRVKLDDFVQGLNERGWEDTPYEDQAW